MSRVGRKTIQIPEGVTVALKNDTVEVKGPKGELSYTIRPEVQVAVEGSAVQVTPKVETKQTAAYWGLTRQLIANMIEGTNTGFEKQLELQGVGYKAELQGMTLHLELGYSHPIDVTPPDGIAFTVEKNIVTVSGIDKDLVGNTAAHVKKLRPVEPYKGKGIRYVGEYVRRKAGKKAAAAE